MQAPDLSIVIVNWNTADLLRACLASLPAATAGRDCETLVVDNGSHDDSVAMVREHFPQVRLIEAGANLGFARANNLAIAQTSGRNVLLLNPDTVCPPGSLARLLDAAERNPDHGGCGPLLVDAAGRPTTSYGNFPALRFAWLRPIAGLPLGRRWRQWSHFTHAPGRAEPERTVEYVMGACLLLTRTALERVGPLDERFFLYFEETDWCLRARRAGLPVRLVTGVEVVHLEGRAAELASRFSLVQFHASHRLFMAKHRGRGAVLHLRLALLWAKGLQAAWHALHCWSPRRRRLARRYAFEAGLQLRAELRPQPPA